MSDFQHESEHRCPARTDTRDATMAWVEVQCELYRGHPGERHRARLGLLDEVSWDWVLTQWVVLDE